MLPMEFDHHLLSGLPLPDSNAQTRVAHLLDAVVARRVLPYFVKKRMTDPIRVARVSERYTISRLEDFHSRIRVMAVLTQSIDGWVLQLHECVFDYFAFVLPTNADTRLAEATAEQRRGLAYCELLLRHELDHMINPERSEREVVTNDAVFAMDRRDDDPTYYRTLREALTDELSGLRSPQYLDLLDRAERGEQLDAPINVILGRHTERVAELPGPLIKQQFAALDREIRTRVIDACYRRSRSTSLPLIRRARYLRRLLWLFHDQLASDAGEAAALFAAFKDRWGAAVLLQELDVPEPHMDALDQEHLFELFASRLRALAADKPETSSAAVRPATVAEQRRAKSDESSLSLRDRIEIARNDPRIPRAVLDLIDKNQANTQGVSGAKYTELLETLLAIPWSRLHKIDLSPEALAAGLDAGHHGLSRPKELLVDFFTNLIWRYRGFIKERATSWHNTGSAFLFVGPPGVGKTSLAISLARCLGVPYHKLSLGGMRDESDLRGHGFTYEGSKPGAIVQGLLKMGVMNGVFIMDEADKSEQIAVATLLEILDPEQNHLFHDKYAGSTVDIDLSNCHFVLTANTLETVPAAVTDRCEVIWLDRYSVEEKVAIAQDHLIHRVRSRHAIREDQIVLEAEQSKRILREIVMGYTHEAGVRQLERILRTLFLRLHRSVVSGGEPVTLSCDLVQRTVERPQQPRRINLEDRVGEVMALGVDVERGLGAVIPVQATSVPAREAAELPRQPLTLVEATGNLERVMDESRRVAITAILHCAGELRVEPQRLATPIHLHLMGGSLRKDGPSAGGAIALALASLLGGFKLRRDVAMTGEIDTQGRITGVGGLEIKIDTAYDAGCKTVIIPRDNLQGRSGLGRLSETLRREIQVLTFDEWRRAEAPFDHSRHLLQVVAVQHITQAAEIAFIRDEELARARDAFAAHAKACAPQVAQATARLKARPLVLGEPCDELASLRAAAPGVRLVQLHQDGRRNDEAVRQSLEAIDTLAGADTPVVLVGPLEVLQRREIASLAAASGGRVWRFADDRTVQGLEVGACRGRLRRLACHLSHLCSRRLTCDLLGEVGGVVAVTLSIIPEKYRLDPSRAVAILASCLDPWLAHLEAPRGEALPGGARVADQPGL